MAFPMLQNPAATFVTIRGAQDNSADYVNILFDMIRRNLPPDLQCRFACMTCDASHLDPGIEILPLPEDRTLWEARLSLFEGSLFKEGMRIIYIDPETLVTDSLVDLLTYQGDLAALRDFNDPEKINTGIMLWRSGYAGFMWDDFLKAGISSKAPGDDIAWMKKSGLSFDILQDLFPGFFAESVSARTRPPEGAHIIRFENMPKPHEITEGWVKKTWAKGGHFRQSFGKLGDPLDHVRHALTLPFPQIRRASPPELQRAVCLVGSGKSRERYLNHLQQAKHQDYEIWALGEAYAWLVEVGIEPNVHILASPLLKEADCVPLKTEAVLLYASHCHPEVFLRASASSSQVVVWHPAIEGINSLPDFGESLLIGGGSATEMLAISLAFNLGCRTLHLFGYDASFEDEEEGDVPANEAEQEHKIYVQVDDKRFLSSLRLAGQVKDFHLLLKSLVPQGLGINMHGEGLLPYAMQKIMNKQKSN